MAAVVLLGAGIELAVTAPGAILVGIGVAAGSRRAVDSGSLCLVAGIAVVGIGGGSPARLVPSALLATVAWDAGAYAIALGRQLGSEAVTRRAEVVHAALTMGVGAVGAVVVYGAYRGVAGEQPAIVLTLLLAGAVLLIAAVR